MRKIRFEKGYSLVELLIVVVILAILTAIAIPQINGAMQSNRLNAANALLVSKLSEARIQSIKRNSPVSLKINTTTNRVWLESSGSQINQPERLAGDVSFEFSPSSGSSEQIVTFNSFGNLVNQPVSIKAVHSNAKLSKNIQISLSGKIEVGQMTKYR